MGPYSADSCGRGYSVNCAYPTRGTGKRDSTREFPLDLYREHFNLRFLEKIQCHHFSCQKCKHVSIKKKIAISGSSPRDVGNPHIVYRISVNKLIYRAVVMTAQLKQLLVNAVNAMQCAV